MNRPSIVQTAIARTAVHLAPKLKEKIPAHRIQEKASSFFLGSLFFFPGILTFAAGLVWLGVLLLKRNGTPALAYGIAAGAALLGLALMLIGALTVDFERMSESVTFVAATFRGIWDTVRGNRGKPVS